MPATQNPVTVTVAPLILMKADEKFVVWGVGRVCIRDIDSCI